MNVSTVLFLKYERRVLHSEDSGTEVKITISNYSMFHGSIYFWDLLTFGFLNVEASKSLKVKGNYFMPSRRSDINFGGMGLSASLV